MRIIATVALLLIGCLTATAQKEVPIQSNPLLESLEAERLEDLGVILPENAATLKNEDCYQPADDTLFPVVAGETRLLDFFIDTVGLGIDGTFECTNCNSLTGTADIFVVEEFTTNQLEYTAPVGVILAIDSVRVRYCNADAECSPELVLPILARRAGANTFPAPITIGQEVVTNVTINNNLPGDQRCNFFADCFDIYEGRDPLAFFADYSQPTNEFIYRAGRFAGTDSVCVVLCDIYGICDTAHYAFKVNVTSINPPIYDDFSYEGPTPNIDLWLDREAFVNQQMPWTPPSIGVVSFDGLSERGRPYGSGFGETDRLTSTYLDTDNGDWTLSFYLQRGGIADRPEFQDSLVLQFRESDGDWISVRQFVGMSTSTPLSVRDTFRYYQEPITTDFQHDRFQFRFISHGDRGSLRDVWHLDYVRLDQNASGSSNFNDIAFSQAPNFLLKPYTSMPWRHFQPQLDEVLDDSIAVALYNHFPSAQNASPSTVELTEQNTGINPWGITPTLFNGQEANIDPSVPINRFYELRGNDPTGFSNVWDDYVVNMDSNQFDGFDELDFNLRYRLNNTSQSSLDFVQNNDEVSRTTHFGNYFAYDDGTAESALETTAGRTVAVKYTAGVNDTIRGVRFHFPHTSEDVTDQRFLLEIWVGELDAEPDFSTEYQPIYTSSVFDSLQGFTSYLLRDAAGNPSPLAINGGEFHVGWRQLTTCSFGDCIPVGYDLNNEAAEGSIMVQIGSVWQEIIGLRPGALMIRPVLTGGEDFVPTSAENITASEPWQMYPNPSQGIINFWGDFTAQPQSIHLFNSTGQRLQVRPWQSQWDVSTLPSGLYFVRLQTAEGNLSPAQRLIITN